MDNNSELSRVLRDKRTLGRKAQAFYLPYFMPGWCAVHGWHASNVCCPLCAASSPATKASEGGSAAASDGSEPETSGHGSAERLSRPAVPSSEASVPASEPAEPPPPDPALEHWQGRKGSGNRREDVE